MANLNALIGFDIPEFFQITRLANSEYFFLVIVLRISTWYLSFIWKTYESWWSKLPENFHLYLIFLIPNLFLVFRQVRVEKFVVFVSNLPLISHYGILLIYFCGTQEKVLEKMISFYYVGVLLLPLVFCLTWYFLFLFFILFKFFFYQTMNSYSRPSLAVQWL